MQRHHPSARFEDARGSLQPQGPGAVMRRFIDDVINSGNFSALEDLVDPDCIYRAPDRELHRRDRIDAPFVVYRARLPDLHTDIDDLVSADDKVVIAFTPTGTDAGFLTGIDATGKKVSANGMVLGLFEDGKIIEE